MEPERIQVWFGFCLISAQSLIIPLIAKAKPTTAIKKYQVLFITISCHRRQKTPICWDQLTLLLDLPLLCSALIFFFNNFTVRLYFPGSKQTAGCILNNSEDFGSMQVPRLCQKSFSDGPEFLFIPLCQGLTSGKEKIQLKAIKSNVLFIFLLTELFSGHLRNENGGGGRWKNQNKHMLGFH